MCHLAWIHLLNSNWYFSCKNHLGKNGIDTHNTIKLNTMCMLERGLIVSQVEEISGLLPSHNILVSMSEIV
jgi:hypothetical protein